MPYIRLCAAGFLASLIFSALCGEAPATAPVTSARIPDGDFAAARKKHPTHLIREEPSPQKWKAELPPADVREVTYDSGELKLKAWFSLPAGASKDKPVPALVYFHGGFAFGGGDFKDCAPFIEAGFAVMTPTLRGENGNPGNYEMFYGEVNDGRAALDWVAAQPEVDAKHIYTFGHSAGGCISALLSLYADTPARMTGSAGGMYLENSFGKFGQKPPFDVNDEQERRLRAFPVWAGGVKIPHVAYFGGKDFHVRAGVAVAEPASVKTGAPIRYEQAEGDHFKSLNEAFRRYLDDVKADIAGKEFKRTTAAATAYSEADGGFSYELPAGWDAQPTDKSKFKMAVGQTESGAALSIVFIKEAEAVTLDDYAGKLSRQFGQQPNVKVLREDAFQTGGGLAGKRLVMSRGERRQNLYMFAGPADQKIAIACTCLEADAEKAEPAFEAIMKSFSIVK